MASQTTSVYNRWESWMNRWIWGICILLSYTFSICILRVDRTSFSLVDCAWLQCLTGSLFIPGNLWTCHKGYSTDSTLLLPLAWYARALLVFPQEDGSLLGIGCADQVTHGTEPWEMALEPKVVMQMRNGRACINKPSLALPNHVWVWGTKKDWARTVSRESGGKLGSKIFGIFTEKKWRTRSTVHLWNRLFASP